MTSMKSICMREGAIILNEIDIPIPKSGQVLVKSLACGICGSDLHITRHGDEVFDIYKKLGVMSDVAGASTDIMLGHEFAAEVVSFGANTKGNIAIGTRVTCVPLLMTQGGVGVGVTPGVYGAYSEYFIVDEALLLPIPETVSSEAAALTEPLAVGLHAVNRSEIKTEDVALVAGCGSIGLAAIAALRIRGVKHIIASDPKENKRKVAQQFGATHTVDPIQTDEVTFAAKLAGENRVVIFECIGVHQLINSFIVRAPMRATLVITGIHTADTQVNFGYATVKEMDIKCSYYYNPEEFAESLQHIADGKVDWQKMCTGKVGIDGVTEAIDTLLKPNDHIKIIIEPWRNGTLMQVGK